MRNVLTALALGASLSACTTPAAVRPAPAPTPARAARADSAPLPGAAGPSPNAPRSLSASDSARTRLRAMADSIIERPEFRNARWGLLIVDPSRGDTLYSHDADKLFMPASNMKLVTTAVAMQQLGAAYRFRTIFAARGVVKKGVLRGDLLVIGRGDPSVSDHLMKDAMIPLRAAADSLTSRGIARVTGHVLPFGDAFPGPTLGYGWSWDDLDADYGAPVDELEFNEGFAVVHVHAAPRAGRAPTLLTTPAPRAFTFRNLARTIRRGEATQPLTAVRDTASGTVVVRGTIALGDSASLVVVQPNQDAAYADALSEALREAHIGIANAASDTAARIDTLFAMQSPTLIELMPPLLKPSQNQMAEAVFHAIGLEITGVGSADSARAVVARQLIAWGAEPDGFIVHDGSGLSRYDYVTPRTMIHVLDALRRMPAFDAYYAALPIAGVDGTLQNRMRGSAAEANVHAKTGTFANARSLSGYVTTADGTRLEFSMLVNNYSTTTAEVSRAQDALAAALASMRLH